MSDQVFCKLPACAGILCDVDISVSSSTNSYLVCEICGRLYSREGHMVFTQEGAAMFLKGDDLLSITEPKSFIVGAAYISTAREITHVEFKHEDEDDKHNTPPMVDLPPGTKLIFDGMDGDTFKFHSFDGSEFLLHFRDISGIEEV